jgi:hypothetical protein
LIEDRAARMLGPSHQEADMRILEKIAAYFEACSESFASEGQVFGTSAS